MPEEVINDISGLTFLNDSRYPRGMRNNNPGNIRYNKNLNWQGKVPKSESKDKSFEQFKKYWYGVRALILVLNSYYIKHNLQTIEKIINRFAPPIENETETYVSKVCKYTGFKAREQFIFNRHNVHLLVKAITHHECGRDALISENLFALAWLNCNID